MKMLLSQTKYNKESDIFDWMNSFEFNKLIKSLDNNFDIFSNIIKSPLTVDLHQTNERFFNNIYSFRLPHEKNINDSKITYARRYERFLNYKNTDDNYLFIRVINGGNYGISHELIENNYNEQCFNQIMTYLPSNSKILLLNHRKMESDSLNKIYNKFIIIDDCINAAHANHGPYVKHKDLIIKCYNSCFEYIDTNFNNLDVKIIYDFIKNEHLVNASACK